ncbi:MAG: polysaccharide biosynthesis/export family protein [Desulfobacterales bacterium]|nr:MAG: polysaccharide biosynthesis/export family protein [Desulfobacterales bacterium]
MKIEKAIGTVMAVIFCLITACSSNKAVEKSTGVPMTPVAPKLLPYSIQPGDQLDIKFFYNPELNETVTVRPDGMITLQLIDDVKVAGLSPSELDALLTKEYSKDLRKPVLSVIVRTFTAQRVFVGGEVVQPGLVQLAPGMHPVQAVFQAGGFRETAKPEAAIVIRKGEGNKPIPVLLDLNDAMYGVGQGASFELQPDDIVYIPKSTIAKVNKWVDEYIQGMLMFNGWSFGIGYELDKEDKWKVF